MLQLNFRLERLEIRLDIHASRRGSFVRLRRRQGMSVVCFNFLIDIEAGITAVE
jgi:hypothetical protein